MLSYACGHCGQLVFFENSRCLHCDTPLGFVVERMEVVALEGSDGLRHRCANAVLARCNWMADRVDALCRSCELTRTRPADGDAVGLHEFADAEAAKRRLVFQLLDLGLPDVTPERLHFDLLSSQHGPVTTGHADGVVTIDLAESDDAQRAQRREQLAEPYRTMLGTLRHELGHYFQPRLVTDDATWARCRNLFGDERTDYGVALQRHYEDGPPPDWPRRYVSAYATMHPWEDWAETFAHYLHIRDTLQTAAAYGMAVRGPRAARGDRSLQTAPRADEPAQPFDDILEDWLPLTYALNAVNRSMGESDLYPFVLAAPVIDKLRFVHERVVTIGARAGSGDDAEAGVGGAEQI